MAYFFPRGEIMMPYGTDVLEKTVAAHRGKLIPGCRFKVTMHSSDTPSAWSLPCVIRGKYVELDEGVRIRYRVWPSPIVWLLLLLPFAAIVAMALLEIVVEKGTTVLGLAIAAVCFAYGFQRMKAIERFEKRFGK